MPSTFDIESLEQCITLAVDSVASGGGPFAALLVRDGQVIARAWNRVVPNCDPTAHAEVEALRQGGTALGTPHLDDCTLYASCEPCPMCLAAALWSRVSRIVYAAPHDEAIRAGFADTHIARQLYGQSGPVALQEGLLEPCPVPRLSAPFDAWLARSDRIPY